MMKKALHAIYTLWGAFWFWATFVLLFPFFMLIVWHERLHPLAFYLNKIWAFGVYFPILIPVRKKQEAPFVPGQHYIFCANHNSYMDIPLVGLTAPHYIVFIGKKELANVPFFGIMFRKLYVPVDRNKRKDSYRAFEQASASVAKGKSLLVFPEGKINPRPPLPAKFKDGAFRIAIEQQVPIVPVSIPHHWKVFHDVGLHLAWHPVSITYHKPIPTTGLTLADLESLKAQVYQVIYEELSQHYPECETQAHSGEASFRA